MKVRVRLFANLRSYAPQGSERGEWEMELPPGARVPDCLQVCGISIDLAAVIMKNGLICGLDEGLADGDELSLFPPLAGG